ncbi:MAG: hypothetical protein HY661_14755 [Betaproteobacteria bacterium]|nr:hypothetical protein [Betaproteobacteria bacterium]
MRSSGARRALPVLLGFVAPAGILLQIVIAEPESPFNARFFELAANTLTLAGIAALPGDCQLL